MDKEKGATMSATREALDGEEVREVLSGRGRPNASR